MKRRGLFENEEKVDYNTEFCARCRENDHDGACRFKIVQRSNEWLIMCAINNYVCY